MLLLGACGGVSRRVQAYSIVQISPDVVVFAELKASPVVGLHLTEQCRWPLLTLEHQEVCLFQ